MDHGCAMSPAHSDTKGLGGGKCLSISFLCAEDL